MDKKKIFLINLSKGRIGEDNSALLGAMMITKIQLAAMSRVDIPENQREDFYLYVDEFQNFATESFANILSEARKYRLNLIIAHQYIEQLDEKVSAAVFGNVCTIMCFRVGAADAEYLVKEFTPYFEEDDLVNLTKYDIYMKLMIDGVSSSPFSAATLPPLSKEADGNNAEKIINSSRERYSTPKDIVEEKIARWSSMVDENSPQSDERGHVPKENFEPQRFKDEPRPQRKPLPVKFQAPSKPMKDFQETSTTTNIETKGTGYVVECYECGNPTEVHFKPDGIRPVYCKDCFKKIRQNVIRGSNDIEKEEIEKKPVLHEISLSESINQEPMFFSKKKTPDADNRKSSPSVEPVDGGEEQGIKSNQKVKILRQGEIAK